MSLIKIAIVVALIFIIYNLFRAMFIMLKGNPEGQTMSTFIGRRLMFSVALIVLLLIALAFGLITPNPRPY